MAAIKQAKAPRSVCRTVYRSEPKDRRKSGDRRCKQVNIGHTDRRKEGRRQTELHALIWQNIRLRA